MKNIFEVEMWQQVIVQSLTELAGTVAAFLPSFVGSLLILLLGWAVSRVVELLSGRILRRLELDRVADRLRVTETLSRAGLSSKPSGIVARLLFWIIMLTFVLSAVETLGLSAVTATIDRLIAFLPNVVAASLIFLIGLLLARFARSLVSSGAAVADITHARRLGAAANAAVTIVVAVLALEQLGIQTELLVTVITVLLATAGLTMGAAFSLGARSVVTHILAGHYLRQSLPAGGVVEIDGRRGAVERVGPVDTIFRDEERSWSIPNARLLDEIVLR